jgi:hypothetical protein
VYVTGMGTHAGIRGGDGRGRGRVIILGPGTRQDPVKSHMIGPVQCIMYYLVLVAAGR